MKAALGDTPQPSASSLLASAVPASQATSSPAQTRTMGSPVDDPTSPQPQPISSGTPGEQGVIAERTHPHSRSGPQSASLQGKVASGSSG